MLPLSKSSFILTGNGYRADFVINEDGRVTKLKVTMGGQTLEAPIIK